MSIIAKPTNRESIVLFGDGDEAVFGHTTLSHEEGYRIFHFRPTAKMRWTKQIQDEEYDQHDRWIKKIYKDDLCILLSSDPDFPFWAILCDYDGIEKTPLMKVFQRDKMKIRELQREIQLLKTERTTKRIMEMKKAQYPTMYEQEMLDRIARHRKAAGDRQIIPSQIENIPLEEES